MINELERLIGVWGRAWLEKDASTVEQLMAADCQYVAPNGQVFDRAALLDIIRSPGYQLHEGVWSEVTVKPLGNDSAVTLDRWRGKGTFNGNSFTEDHRCTIVWARREGFWQIVSEHCSAVTP